jgi:hypothetical protein
MKPVRFEGCNTTFAKSQPGYLPLPAHKTAKGLVTSCWKLSLWERLAVATTGRMFLQMLTFNRPLQPLKMSVFKPWKR